MVKKTVQHLRGGSTNSPSASGGPNAGGDKPASGADASASKAKNAKPANELSEEELRMSPAARNAHHIRGEMKRETVESIVVAIILALLFRGFVAEMFVIPTGSMAPALMGAHKDIFCPQCGNNYQVNASVEDRAPKVVAGAICDNCRYWHGLDLKPGTDDATFSGDRIMVSKFSYTLFEPKRWDVAVFKFPGNPKQNYIKRVVGLPNESVLIHHGDIYVQPGKTPLDASVNNLDYELQRKPAEKLMAMSQHVYDSQHQAQLLNDAGYPAPWQPWAPGSKRPEKQTAASDAWSTSVADSGLIAKAGNAAGDDYRYLRYFHRPPTMAQWEKASRGLSLRDVDPYEGRAVTDFYAYNAFIHVFESEVYRVSPKRAWQESRGFNRFKNFLTGPDIVFNSDYKPGDLSQFGNQLSVGSNGIATEGMHWVGDLIAEVDLETTEDAKQVQLQIVESGIVHQCEIDLKTGTATLSLEDRRTGAKVDNELLGFGPEPTKLRTVTGETAVTAGTRHRLRFSNADDQLVLWVDDELVEFAGPTTFDHRAFLTADEDRPRYTDPDPLDAAPVLIGLQGGGATAHSLKVLRDKYYIAMRGSSGGFSDYDAAPNILPGEPLDQQLRVQRRLNSPTTWGDTKFWASRRTVAFEQGEDQFFPLGDNSPESKDARCWVDPLSDYVLANAPDADAYKWSREHYVPRDLLVGKAIAVFWPHMWNTGARLNLGKVRLIR